MISERSVYGYIGGSDANRLYGSFGTKTFRDFWQERTSGIKLNQFDTLDTAVGNIMESRVADEVGIPAECRDVFLKKEGTIAGCNFDGLTDVVHEIKTALPDYVAKWVFGRKVSANYRRQLMHAMYVSGTKMALLHVLPMSKGQKENPFMLDIKGKVVTFEFPESEFDMEEHDRRVRYLTKCFHSGEWPTDNGLAAFKL